MFLDYKKETIYCLNKKSPEDGALNDQNLVSQGGITLLALGSLQKCANIQHH